MDPGVAATGFFDDQVFTLRTCFKPTAALRSSGGKESPAQLLRKFVVQSDPDDVVRQLDIGIEAGASEERVRAKVEKEVFGLHGPVGIQHLLDAATDSEANPV